LKTPREAEALLGQDWWISAQGSSSVEGQFPITMSYNTVRSQDMRISFTTIARKSVDGTLHWKTKPRSKKQQQLDKEQAVLNPGPARSIFFLLKIDYLSVLL